MTDTYASIADGYKKAKLHPWRHYIEEHTLDLLVGDVKGKAVLDLACGEGFHTRRLKLSGAARVVGVDLSRRMIDLARAEEQRHSLGIEYVEADAAAYSPDEPFDLVVAAYLLNYARTPDQLRCMARTIARSLKPGCRFVAVNDNLRQSPTSFQSTKKYGLVKSIQGERREGSVITCTLFTDGKPISFDNYYLKPETYEQTLEEAGLGTVRWHSPHVSPEGEAAHGREYWSGFLEQPPITFLECTRQP
ncbi:class I SAM-dependent methyltransferase [Mycolicibacterium boenickei]